MVHLWQQAGRRPADYQAPRPCGLAPLHDRRALCSTPHAPLICWSLCTARSPALDLLCLSTTDPMQGTRMVFKLSAISRKQSMHTQQPLEKGRKADIATCAAPERWAETLERWK